MEKNEDNFLPQAPPPYVVASYGNVPGGPPPGSIMVSVPHGVPVYADDGSAPMYSTGAALPGYEGAVDAAQYGHGQQLVQAAIVIAQGNCPKCRVSLYKNVLKHFLYRIQNLTNF